jgi:hypothetical protein
MAAPTRPETGTPKPYFSADLRAFPLVITTYLRSPSTEDCEIIAQTMQAIFRRRERVFFVADMQRLTVPDAAGRKRAAEIAERFELPTRAYVIGQAIVMRSSVIRGTLTALRWLVKPAAPEYYVASMAEAAEIAEARMIGDGLTLTPMVRHRLLDLKSPITDVTGAA